MEWYKDNLIACAHESLIQGQRRDMVGYIDQYGDDFFSEYKRYLKDTYEYLPSEYVYFTDAVLSYFRIKGR
jgi:hypothetical protein